MAFSGKKVTLMDIARRCNLSISTVSRALKNEKNISLQTKERVMGAARELGYFVERGPSFFKQEKLKLIGLIISDVENMYFHGMARAIEDTVANSGYSLILCNTDENSDEEAEYMKVLLQKEVDGVLLSPTGNRIPWIQEFRKRNIPIVIIDREIKDLDDIDYVGVNNREASIRAVEYLIRLGHRRIAIIIGMERLITFRERLEGYREALRKHNIPIDERLVLFATERSIAGSRKAVQNLLSSNIPPPTAMFCANNLMTLGAYVAAKNTHIIIPDQLSILGFDDFQWSEALNPPLTAVSQPTYAIGVTAAQLLLRRIEKGNSVQKQRVIMDLQLTERESCGGINLQVKGRIK